MKKALFIGHSYHTKTKSSAFLTDILQREYDVTQAYIDPSTPFSLNDLKVSSSTHFDLLVIWQVMPDPEEIRKIVSWDCAVFFPMYDQYQALGGFYDDRWSGYVDFLIVCFSKVLYDDVVKAGFDARYIKYFPQPKPVEDWGDEHGVFFWQRITLLNKETLVEAVRPLDVRKVHLHNATDPGNQSTPLHACKREVQDFFCRQEVSESTWFNDKSQLYDTISRLALYMAPRLYEGIGMSFLDAMAMGRCVIAPDLPTMNEYIIDGVNGILYPWDSQRHCPAGCNTPQRPIQEIQKNAYKTIQAGYEQWTREQGKILEWCTQHAHPRHDVISSHAVRYGWKDWPIEQQAWPDVQQLDSHGFTKEPVKTSADATTQESDSTTPDISVVTVIYNLIENGRKDSFLQCLDSVQEQQGVTLEHVIIDGASTDGTMEIVRQYRNHRHPIRCLSMKDSGIYEAMNRGIAWSQGTAVIFLNSDDYYHNPQGLRHALSTMRKTGCDFTFAPIVTLNSTNPHSPHVTPASYLNDIFYYAAFSHQSVLAKRQTLVNLHGFDLSYRSAADYDLVLRMLLSGHKGCYVNLSFVSYRMTGFSSTDTVLSDCETGLIFRRLYARYLGAQLTSDDARRIVTEHRLPKHLLYLKRRQRAIIKKSFVGMPNCYLYLYRCYLPELWFVCKALLHGRLTLICHFFLIHFNSRFKRKWYLHRYEDVCRARQAPAAHYLCQGWREGRDPSLRFSTQSYLNKNPDVAAMDICPLIHWKLKGRREHRDT